MPFLKAVLQRVCSGQVLVSPEEAEGVNHSHVQEVLQEDPRTVVVGRIGRGLAVLVGVAEGDTEDTAVALAGKVASLRVFPGPDGKMNQSLADIQGKALVVSQFTLLGDAAKGNRPNFMRAAKPDVALPVFDRFVESLRNAGITVATGIFGADMRVELVCDGPVTILLEK